MNKINLLTQSLHVLMDWREKLKKLRLQNNYTQAKVAEELGITPSTYGKIENGLLGLDIDKAIRLTKLYNTSLENLFINPEQTEPIGKVAEPAGAYNPSASKKPFRLLLELNPDQDEEQLPSFLGKLQKMIKEFNEREDNSPDKGR